MFKAGDCERVLDSPAATALILVVLLALPVLASSDATVTGSRDAPRLEAYPTTPGGPYNHQMRCWEHGREVLERKLLDWPADEGEPLVESGRDRLGLPVYTTAVGNAVCLVRPIIDPGLWPPSDAA